MLSIQSTNKIFQLMAVGNISLKQTWNKSSENTGSKVLSLFSNPGLKQTQGDVSGAGGAKGLKPAFHLSSVCI